MSSAPMHPHGAPMHENEQRDGNGAGSDSAGAAGDGAERRKAAKNADGATPGGSGR